MNGRSQVTKGAFGGSTGKRTWHKKKWNKDTKRWNKKKFTFEGGKGSVGNKLG